MVRSRSKQMAATILIILGGFILHSQSIGQSKRKQKDRDLLSSIPKAEMDTSVFAEMPDGWSWVNYMGQRYFFGEGNYHVKDGNGSYEQVEAPMGIRILCLPLGYRIVQVDAITYYVYKGVFYTTTPIGEFEVVAPPVGQKVKELPAGAQLVNIGGKVYWLSEGIYYQELLKGEDAMYEVIGLNQN